MKSVVSKIKELNNLSIHDQYKYFKLTYPNLCDDIINYVLIRHLGATQIYEEFDFIDLTKCEVEKLDISTEQVFDIEYAQFCVFRNESKEYFDGWRDKIEYEWTKNGTWIGPILVTLVNNKYVVIDGNNRLRILRCFLKFSDKHKSTYHSIYFIHN